MYEKVGLLELQFLTVQSQVFVIFDENYNLSN